MAGAVIEDTMRTRIELIGLGGFLGNMQSIAHAFGLVDGAATAAQKKALSAGIAYASAGVGLAGMLLKAGMSAGQLGRVTGALETVTGSTRAAKAQMDAVRGSSAAQLFGTENVARAALNLRNMGADANMTQLAITAMANATSAAGGDQSEFMAGTESVGRALQMEHLGMRELRSITRASAPAFKLLADSMGVTVSQLENMTFTGQRAKDKIRELLEQENKIHGAAAQHNLSTFAGQWDRLGNVMKDAQQNIGTAIDEPLGNAAKSVADIVSGFNRMPDWVFKGTAAAGSLLALLAVGRGVGSILGRFPAGVAMMGRMGAGFRMASPAGLTAAAVELGANFIPNKNLREKIQGAAAGAGIGGTLGALLGARAGAPGAAAGGAGGAVAGGYLGLLLATAMQEGKFKMPGMGGAAAANPQLTELQKQTAALESIRASVETMLRGEVFSPTDTPGSFQALAAARFAGMMR